MTEKELLSNKILSRVKEKILCDLKGVYYVSIFDVAFVLKIQRPNIYKLIELKVFKPKEFGGAKFVTVESLLEVYEEREKKKEIIIFHKGSLMRTTGIAPIKLVKTDLYRRSPEEKKKALSDISASAEEKDAYKSLIIATIESQIFSEIIGKKPNDKHIKYSRRILFRIMSDFEIKEVIANASKKAGIPSKKQSDFVNDRLSVKQIMDKEPHLLFDVLILSAWEIYNGSKNVFLLQDMKKFDL